MRKRILALLCALLLLAGTLPTASALEGEAVRAADTLAALHLLSGSYAVKDPATRAQAAVLLVRLAGAETAAASSSAGRSAFRGAPAWALPSIAYAYSRGWITSTSAEEYRAEETVTADAWCSMLLRMLGYSDQKGDFSTGGAAQFARHIGLTTQDWDGALKRGEVFQIMRDALTFSYKNGSGTVAERLISSGACDRATVSALGLLDRELTAREAADRHTAAVFRLALYTSERQVKRNDPDSYSSGFFISGDGKAVTNYHSIKGGVYADVTLITGEIYPVESVLYYDPDADIAVLQVSRTSTEGETASGFACLDLVGVSEARPGDEVYTLSNPLGFGLAVSSGVVSAVEWDVAGYSLPCIVNTADISQGSSGGALMNVYGHVMAITTGAYARGNSMYVGVPVDPVMNANLTSKHWTLKEVKEIEAAKLDKALGRS